MDDQANVLIGREAAALLENSVLREVWDGIERECIEALAAVSMKPDAKDDRDALIWHLKLVRKQRGAFFGMVELGKFAQHRIDEKREKDSAVKRFARRVVTG
jgi:hypothetical protein